MTQRDPSSCQKKAQWTRVFLVNGFIKSVFGGSICWWLFFFGLLLLVDTFRRHEESPWMMDSGEFQVDELVGVRPRFCST